jgi:transcriptional regulator with XRE-family HTH domain
MAPPRTVHLSRGLAQRVRAVRVRQRLTQDDVADRARELGLAWGRDTVAKIETGDRELKLVEFLLLPVILGRPLADLLPPKGWVGLTPSVQVSAAALAGLLRGEVVGSPEAESLSLPAQGNDIRTIAIAPAGWTAVKPVRPVIIRRDALREAERKAAKRLGLDPIELSTLAHKVWGVGLTEKRDQLLTEQAKAGDTKTRQALRGWVTRQLDKELADKEVKE